MFPAYPAGMLPTLRSKIWRLPILTGSDQVRSGMFTTHLLSRTVGLCLRPVVKCCPGVEPWQAGKCFQTQQLQYRRRKVCPTSCRDKQQDGCEVGRAKVCYFADPLWQAGKLQPILTDTVNIAPDPPKIHSYRQDGSRWNTPIRSNYIVREIWFTIWTWKYNPRYRIKEPCIMF